MRTRPLKKVKNLTKREYFAVEALRGLIASKETGKNLVELSVKIADKLIEELNKEENEQHT